MAASCPPSSPAASSSASPWRGRWCSSRAMLLPRRAVLGAGQDPARDDAGEVRRLHKETAQPSSSSPTTSPRLSPLSSRVAIFNQWRGAADRRAAGGLTSGRKPLRREFLGQINLLPLTRWRRTAPADCIGRCEAMQVGVRGTRPQLWAGGDAGGAARAHALSLQQPADRNCRPATVAGSTYLGGPRASSSSRRRHRALRLVPTGTAAASSPPARRSGRTWASDQGFLLPGGD